MKTVVVDVTRTKRFALTLRDEDGWQPYMNKYEWAVGTGRFEGTLAEYTAHLGAMNAPEVKCIDDGFDNQKIKLISIVDERTGQ